MDGAAVDVHALGEGALVSVRAAEGGQQRGMDVEHPPFPALARTRTSGRA